MLEWQAWSKSAEDWDQQAIEAADHTIFQSYGWGEYKRTANWEPIRYACADKNGRTIGMAQLMIKKLPLGFKFIWAPGGPLFVFSKWDAESVDELIKGLVVKLHADHPKALIRFNSQYRHNSLVAFGLSKHCVRPLFRINSGFTSLFQLGGSMEELRKQMSSKHRYYAKRASTAGIEWKAGSSDELLQDFVTVHSEMVREKNLSSIGTSKEQMLEMRSKLAGNIIFLNGYLQQQPVTSCCVLLFGTTAFYMSASTGKAGRDVSAAYAMFEQLMKELTDRNFKLFDFGGLDPSNPNAGGVNHYKGGFGGEIIEQLGEWEHAEKKWIRLLINYAIRFKGGAA